MSKGLSERAWTLATGPLGTLLLAAGPKALLTRCTQPSAASPRYVSRSFAKRIIGKQQCVRAKNISHQTSLRFSLKNELIRKFLPAPICGIVMNHARTVTHSQF